MTDTSRKLLGMDSSIGNFHSVRAKIGREMSKRPRDRGTAETKRNIEACENEVLFRGEDTSQSETRKSSFMPIDTFNLKC